VPEGSVPRQGPLTRMLWETHPAILEHSQRQARPPASKPITTAYFQTGFHTGQMGTEVSERPFT
jgi:hypothetical protein